MIEKTGTARGTSEINEGKRVNKNQSANKKKVKTTRKTNSSLGTGFSFDKKKRVFRFGLAKALRLRERTFPRKRT